MFLRETEQAWDSPRIRSSLSADWNAWLIPDNIKEYMKQIVNSIFSFSLTYISAERRNSTRWYRFFTYSALKKGTETYPALKNELLRKSLSRVGYIKDIFTPHMHNVVQNNTSSSIPHESEITKNRGKSRLFFSIEKFLKTLLPNLIQISNSTKIICISTSTELVENIQEIKKIKKYKKFEIIA